MHKKINDMDYILSIRDILFGRDESMNDDKITPETQSNDPIENSASVTYTQVVSCAENKPYERRRQTLRAQLEREAYELEKEKRLKQQQSSLITSVRGLLNLDKH